MFDALLLVVSVAGAFRISTADFAIALLDEAEPPKHGRTRFTVAY
jgi:putative NADH-flavin reductase